MEFEFSIIFSNYDIGTPNADGPFRSEIDATGRFLDVNRAFIS